MKTDQPGTDDVKDELQWPPALQAGPVQVGAPARSVQVAVRGGMQDGPASAAEQRPEPDACPIDAAMRQRLAGPDMRVQMQLQMQGSGVSRSGRVRSRPERERATHVAWGTPGVRAVLDRLQLAG